MTTTERSGVTSAPWDDALLAAAVFAVAPSLMGGIAVTARAGPVRDAWFAALRNDACRDVHIQRVPAHADSSRLLGGLDLSATLASGRPVAERGLLAQADGGIIVLPNAERIDRTSLAHITAALDSGQVSLERDGFTLREPARFGIIAFDEGSASDEHLPAALSDRLGLSVVLDGISIRATTPAAAHFQNIAEARAMLPTVTISDDLIAALCEAAFAFGIGSMRPSLMAIHASRIAAALDGRTTVEFGDAELALRLVLAPKARRIPDTAPQPPAPDNANENPSQSAPENNGSDADTQELPASDDRLIAAVASAIPAGLLSQLLGNPSPGKRAKSGGRVGQSKPSKQRGRRIRSVRGDLRSGARIDLIATLRTAAPWQTLRRREMRNAGADRDGILIRPADIRVMRFKSPAESATIFVVDASGSSALHRLGEAKGAVEILLADCYARRDSVALIAFRGKTADVLLTPSRSLVRAKRCLAALPGGGGTPLAAAIDAAGELADGVRRRGQMPVVVFMTDGRANVARGGEGGRTKAVADANAAATKFKLSGLEALLIDTSPQRRLEAFDIAATLGAKYVPLPHADALAISDAVRRNTSTSR